VPTALHLDRGARLDQVAHAVQPRSRPADVHRVGGMGEGIRVRAANDNANRRRDPGILARAAPEVGRVAVERETNRMFAFELRRNISDADFLLFLGDGMVVRAFRSRFVDEKYEIAGLYLSGQRDQRSSGV
jgi:hypothetical protein